MDNTFEITSDNLLAINDSITDDTDTSEAINKNVSTTLNFGIEMGSCFLAAIAFVFEEII